MQPCSLALYFLNNNGYSNVMNKKKMPNLNNNNNNNASETTVPLYIFVKFAGDLLID